MSLVHLERIPWPLGQTRQSSTKDLTVQKGLKDLWGHPVDLATKDQQEIGYLMRSKRSNLILKSQIVLIRQSRRELFTFCRILIANRVARRLE